MTQSVASLARAVGPSIAAFLIYSASLHLGQDGKWHNMSDLSLYRTFWTGAGVMFVAFLLSVYFTRAHAAEYADTEASIVSSSPG